MVVRLLLSRRIFFITYSKYTNSGESVKKGGTHSGINSGIKRGVGYRAKEGDFGGAP